MDIALVLVDAQDVQGVEDVLLEFDIGCILVGSSYRRILVGCIGCKGPGEMEVLRFGRFRVDMQ